MTDHLHVWREGHHVGVFTRNDDGITFAYDEDARAPISLSLPLDGGWDRRSPGRFLDNLLPDSMGARSLMATTYAVDMHDIFGLLAGTDTTGGLVFTWADTPPDAGTGYLRPASDDMIASRISMARTFGAAWWKSSKPNRFSLAGSQPKFTLARQDGAWYWSDAGHPSTHIVKPGEEANRYVEEVETVSMRLSRLCGLPTPECGVMTFQGERAFVVERFDRVRDAEGCVLRVHTEDMMQALGLAGRDKYSVKAKQILTLLHRVDPSDGLSYEWIRRLALNTSISNADAHAKNYSLMLRMDGVELSPMYDVLTTTFWPHVDRSLPMRIGGASGAAMLTPHHWRRLADDNRLDPDRVEEIARTTAWLVLEHMDEAYADLPTHVADALRAQIRKANRSMEPTPPSRN